MGLNTGQIGGIAGGVALLGGVLFGDDFPKEEIQGLVKPGGLLDQAATIYDGYTGSGTPAGQPVPQDGTVPKLTKEQTSKKHPNGTNADGGAMNITPFLIGGAGLLVLYLVMR